MDFEKIFIEHWLHFVLTALSSLLTAMVLNLRKKFIKQQGHQKAIEKGIKAILRNELIKSHKYHIEKGHLPIYERDNVVDMFEQYKNLGGNGSIPGLVEELLDLPVREIPGTRST